MCAVPAASLWNKKVRWMSTTKKLISDFQFANNNSASQRFGSPLADGRTTYQTAFGQSSLDRIRQAVFCRPTPKAGFRYFGDGWIRGRIHYVHEHQLGLLHLSAPPTSSSKLNLTSCIIVVKRRSALCFMGMAFVTDARILT